MGGIEREMARGARGSLTERGEAEVSGLEGGGSKRRQGHRGSTTG